MRLKSKCMICDGTPKMFEDVKRSFRHHIAVDHNIWMYLKYIFHITKKSKSDYTGDEIMVMSKYNNLDDSWMPCMTTTYLEVSQLS